MHIDHFRGSLCSGTQETLREARALPVLVSLLSGECGFFIVRSEAGIIVDTRPTLARSGPCRPGSEPRPARILPVGFRDIYYPGFVHGSSFRESFRPAGYQVTVRPPDQLGVLSAFSVVDEWPGWVVCMALWSSETMAVVGYHEISGRGSRIIDRDNIPISFYRKA